jgi:nucleotide-binding universal stress UspA family protein
MTTTPPIRYRIVIALDDSEYAEIVLEHALDQAARHDAPDLHALVVVDDRTDIVKVKQRLAALVLEGLDAFRAGRPDWRTRLHVRRGDPAAEIANLAADIDADLLVVGRYGVHGAHRSVADEVVANATCPTLVVGLTGHAIEPERSCDACAAIREESDGERWFCAEHSAPERLRLTALIPWSTTATHGGPLW